MSQETDIRAFIHADKNTGQMCLFIIRDEFVMENGCMRIKGVYAASGFVWKEIKEGGEFFTDIPSVCRLGETVAFHGGTAII